MGQVNSAVCEPRPQMPHLTEGQPQGDMWSQINSIWCEDQAEMEIKDLEKLPKLLIQRWDQEKRVTRTFLCLQRAGQLGALLRLPESKELVPKYRSWALKYSPQKTVAPEIFTATQFLQALQAVNWANISSIREFDTKFYKPKGDQPEPMIDKVYIGYHQALDYWLQPTIIEPIPLSPGATSPEHSHAFIISISSSNKGLPHRGDKPTSTSPHLVYRLGKLVTQEVKTPLPDYTDETPDYTDETSDYTDETPYIVFVDIVGCKLEIVLFEEPESNLPSVLGPRRLESLIPIVDLPQFKTSEFDIRTAEPSSLPRLFEGHTLDQGADVKFTLVDEETVITEVSRAPTNGGTETTPSNSFQHGQQDKAFGISQ